MKEIKNYNKACNDIKNLFLKKYFDEEEVFQYWIGEEIGGVLGVNDYFFDIKNMITALEHKTKEKDFFNWYWESIEGKNSYITLEAYIKLKKL